MLVTTMINGFDQNPEFKDNTRHERRRLELGKPSVLKKTYSKVTKFTLGMARHLAALRNCFA